MAKSQKSLKAEKETVLEQEPVEYSPVFNKRRKYDWILKKKEKG